MIIENRRIVLAFLAACVAAPSAWSFEAKSSGDDDDDDDDGQVSASVWVRHGPDNAYSFEEFDKLPRHKQKEVSQEALRASKANRGPDRNVDNLVFIGDFGTHRVHLSIMYLNAARYGNGETLVAVRDAVLARNSRRAKFAQLEREQERLSDEKDAIRAERARIEEEDKIGWRIRDAVLKAREKELEAILKFVVDWKNLVL